MYGADQLVRGVKSVGLDRRHDWYCRICFKFLSET